MELRLPYEKIEKIRAALTTHHKRKKIQLRDLQSLIGLLNHACIVVCTGSAFLRRLIDLTIRMYKPLYKIRLTCEARTDIAAWKLFIDSFNGKSLFMSDQWLSSDHFKLFTDAAGSLGFAAVFSHMWFAESWSSPLDSYDITVKELFSYCISRRTLGL